MKLLMNTYCTGAMSNVSRSDSVSTEWVVEATGLSKFYGDRRAVDGIDLRVAAGECFGLLGPNGAGKTTTLRMLLGTTPPSSGTLSLLGYAVPGEARQMRQRLGVVPQTDNLDPDFSVAENLRCYASYFGVSRELIAQRIPDLLAFAALEGRGEEAIANLSGGMKRRLTLARALVNDPDLVILDEPTTGLDPQARQLIWRRLRELKAQGKTLILTTHYMDEAERLCDRLAIMERGRILVEGRPAELIREHIEPQVVELYGAGLAAWRDAWETKLVGRFEQVGETLFCYSEDERPLLASLEAWPELQFLHRRANLEDLFLKLTGKELRDA